MEYVVRTFPKRCNGLGDFSDQRFTDYLAATANVAGIIRHYPEIYKVQIIHVDDQGEVERETFEGR